ncbi:hypothetical protein DY000_02038130 [Brassica cretica]|uniref:DUF1985 domain-containing protein n=1 Tax=Brassica cretica TaxID=69181 RepID=A0ABQ7BQI1_BRACR|nr:hypothetical protein DY000_02038130 [Brassica cretica]
MDIPELPRRIHTLGEEPPAVHSISYHTCWTLHTALKKALHDDKYEDLKESKLGVFIKFQELGFDWASRLVHYMLENLNAVFLKGDFEGDFEADFRRFSLIHHSHRWLSLRRYHRRSHHRSHSRFLYIRYERKPKRAFSQRRLVELRRRYITAMSKAAISSPDFQLDFPDDLIIRKKMDIPELPPLHDGEYEELKESKLGVFIKFQELGFDWASRLVHYMLGFQLDIKKKYELWSLVGPEPVRFSLLEFENLTGLNRRKACAFLNLLSNTRIYIL